MITALVGLGCWLGLVEGRASAQTASVPLEQTSAPTLGQVTAVGFADGTSAWLIARGGFTSLVGTTDGGESWVQVPLERGNLAPLGPAPRDIVAFSSARIGLIGAGDHGWTTTNAGKAWKAGPGPALAVSLTPAGVGWLGVQVDPGHWQSRVTSDGGKSWLDCGPTGDGAQGMPALAALTASGSWMLSRGADGALRVWTSQDNGCNWGMAGDVPSGLYLALSALDGQHAWLVDARGALWVSADGGKSWASQVSPPALQVYFSSVSEGWLVALDGRLHRSTDGGQSWQPLTRDAAVSALASPPLQTWSFGRLMGMLLATGGLYPP